MAEDCGPTAIADRRLTADWETNCGLRINCQLRNRHAAGKWLLAVVLGFATFPRCSHLSGMSESATDSLSTSSRDPLLRMRAYRVASELSVERCGETEASRGHREDIWPTVRGSRLYRCESGRRLFAQFRSRPRAVFRVCARIDAREHGLVQDSAAGSRCRPHSRPTGQTRRDTPASSRNNPP
jgi:hypothetical protein